MTFFTATYRAALLSTLLITGVFATRVHGIDQVDSRVLEAEKQRIAIIAQAKATTISVFAPGGNNGGSGVLISADGYALSNYHVTRAAGDWMRCGLSNGKLYDAVIVGVDPVGDVALIKLLGRKDFPNAKWGDSDSVQQGDRVFAIGNPFLLATNFQPSVSYGIVSGTHRYQYPAGTLLEYTDCIQTDAAINPGNSGGPLFNAKGELIGINGRGSFEKRGRVNVGVGYAISINQIRNFLGHLKSGQILDHASLRATVKNSAAGEVLVDEIDNASNAYRRGLRIGDEILKISGRKIRSANGLKNILGIHPQGRKIRVVFRRGDETREIRVRLQGLHREGELLALLKKQQPQAPPSLDVKNPIDTPSAVAKLLESKQGYANYHFNRVERKRVWKKLSVLGEFAKTGPKWKFKGKIDTGSSIEMSLSDRVGFCDTPQALTRVDFRGPLHEALDPPGSGGLMLALYMWRRLLTVGPDRFGNLHYLGTAPLGDKSVPADVLIGNYRGVSCEFLFDTKTGRLLAIEVAPTADGDPCIIHFLNYKKQDQRLVPGVMRIWHGDRPFGTINLLKIDFDNKSE